MRWSLRLAAAVGVTALLLAGGGATARADDAESRETRALDLFQKSEIAYERGHFADAIALLRQSYDLKHEPVLQYNMGRSYEGLGDLAAAADSYEAFLNAQPNAQDRGALERRIATLRRQLADQQALEKKASERQARAPSAVPWVIAGFGAAGLVTGGVLGVLGGQRNSDAKTEPTYVGAQRLQSQAESLTKVANISFIAGGIILAGGVIWGILDVSAARKSRSRGSAAESFGTFAF
jgi:tetratricopeptide (TPR) repeat protein